LGTPVSPINKSDRHDITEITLKVALNTIKQIQPICNEKIIEPGNIKNITPKNTGILLEHLDLFVIYIFFTLICPRYIFQFQRTDSGAENYRVP
jgi:hypothetical protein